MRRISTLVFTIIVAVIAHGQDISAWKVVYEKEGSVINKVDFYDYLYGVAVGDNGLVLVTDDGGFHWVDYSDESMGDLKSVDLITKTLFFANSDTEAFRTEDGGKSWDKVFSNSSVFINRICKSYVLGSDMTFICCSSGTLYASNSKGNKWFKKDLGGIIKADDNIHYFMGGKYDGYEDSIFQFITDKIGFGQSTDNMKTVFSSSDVLKGATIKNIVEQYDFSPIWFGGDRIFIAQNNKVAFMGAGETDMKKEGVEVVNGCIFLRRMISSNGDNWFGWAVGDDGYMMESKGGTSFKLVEVSSVTDKNLNWIDWGADYHEVPNGSFKYATVCAVGDGIILQKTIDWQPVGFPRLATEVSTEIYPNPFHDDFKIETQGWEIGEKITARLYDMNGTLVSTLYEGILPNGALQLQMAESVGTGIYFVELSSATKREVKRLVRE